MAKCPAEPKLEVAKVYLFGSLRTRSNSSFSVFAGMLGVVETISGPDATSVTGVKSLTTSYGMLRLRNGVITSMEAVSNSV